MAKYHFAKLDDAKKARLNEILSEAREIINGCANGEDVDDMRELLKPRRGFGNYISTLLEIVEEYGAPAPGHKIEEVKDNAVLQDQMKSVVHQLQAMNQIAREVYSAARSELWDAFLNYYGVLNAMASRSHELQMRMKPLVEFMSIKSKKSDADEKDDEDLN